MYLKTPKIIIQFFIFIFSFLFLNSLAIAGELKSHLDKNSALKITQVFSSLNDSGQYLYIDNNLDIKKTEVFKLSITGKFKDSLVLLKAEELLKKIVTLDQNAEIKIPPKLQLDSKILGEYLMNLEVFVTPLALQEVLKLVASRDIENLKVNLDGTINSENKSKNLALKLFTSLKSHVYDFYLEGWTWDVQKDNQKFLYEEVSKVFDKNKETISIYLNGGVKFSDEKWVALKNIISSGFVAFGFNRRSITEKKAQELFYRILKMNLINFKLKSNRLLSVKKHLGCDKDEVLLILQETPLISSSTNKFCAAKNTNGIHQFGNAYYSTPEFYFLDVAWQMKHFLTEDGKSVSYQKTEDSPEHAPQYELVIGK